MNHVEVLILEDGIHAREVNFMGNSLEEAMRDERHMPVDWEECTVKERAKWRRDMEREWLYYESKRRTFTLRSQWNKNRTMLVRKNEKYQAELLPDYTIQIL